MSAAGSQDHIPTLRTGGVEGAELVAIGVTQVGQVDFAGWTFAKTRWVFAGSAPIGYASGMKSVTLFGTLNRKANGAAISCEMLK